MKIRTKIILAVLLLLAVCTGLLLLIWSQYQPPEIVGAQLEAKSEYESLESVTERWFQQWSQQHQGWKVPPSQRIKTASITSLEVLEPEMIEIHYTTAISGWNKEVVSNLELSSTDEENCYQGQWVLQWRQKDGVWTLLASMSPVQYQLQSKEFWQETQIPQTEHYAANLEEECSYLVQDETLYVTYDYGEHLTEVPDGYQLVCSTPNDRYDEYLPGTSYLVTPELTAFVGYSDGSALLLYSTDAGASWQQSPIYTEGAFRANTFFSQTDSICYATFALDRTGGSDYYGTFRSSDLQHWERIELPNGFISNLSCCSWTDDNTGFYSSGAQYYMTTDGGTSYQLYDLPQDEELIASLGFNPYDSLEQVYLAEGKIYFVLGQGEDGDYAKDGNLLKARFVSDDGIHFSFVEEFTDAPTPAG